MKTFYRTRLAALIMLGTCATGWAEPPASPDDTFAAAHQAYDAGRFSDALKLYDGIRDQGLVSAPLYFNRGNALVRLGRYGEAVLSYRRALYLHPRDPDAAANLRFAANLTSALVTEPPAFAAVLGRLTPGEWSVLALSAYWLGALALVLYRLLPRRPRGLLRVAGLAGVLLVVAALGLLHARAYAQRPEVVVTQRDVQSRFAPLADATPHFKVPEGSVVQLVERAGPWCKVAAGANEGWIPSAVCEAVIPLR